MVDQAKGGNMKLTKKQEFICKQITRLQGCWDSLKTCMEQDPEKKEKLMKLIRPTYIEMEKLLNQKR